MLWCGAPPPPSLRRSPLTLLRVAQGLLLDCDAATLTLWVNGEQKGVMVRPGTSSRYPWGPAAARLEGPLRWVVDLSNTTVAVDGPLPLPAA